MDRKSDQPPKGDRKAIIVTNFNKLLNQLLEDISAVFPENTDILMAKEMLNGLNYIANSAVITLWYTYVNMRYQTEIMEANLEFFLQKDYSQDFANKANSGIIIAAIDKIRDPIRQMSESNKATSLKYIQNLCKLAAMYNE
jgi:hypothetical protein